MPLRSCRADKERIKKWQQYEQNLDIKRREKIVEIKITSIAVEDGDTMLRKCPCEGEDFSPPLTWNAVPESTKSIALIRCDSDATMGTFVHWELFNLPPDTAQLPDATYENGAYKARQLQNDIQVNAVCIYNWRQRPHECGGVI